MNPNMKKIYRSVLVCCSLLALAGCWDKDPDTPDVPEETVKETRTLTFVLPDAMKQAWAAGDQIVVHGEYAKDQVVVTLDAADISADGKTATKTVEGLVPYKREDCSSELYASWPAAASDNLRHCFFYSKFSTTNAQLMAACNDGDTFAFQNICGVISLSVEGDYEAYTINTPKKEALGYSFLQVKITDSEANFRQYVGEPVLDLQGALSDGKIQVFLPEGASMESGMNVKLMKDGAYVKILRIDEPVSVARGEVLDLGDVTAKLEDYEDPFSSDIIDLDANGNANCYIVTEPGTYKFKAVMGNKPNQFFGGSSDADVLWETWNDDSEVEAGSVVVSATYAEDFIIVHMPETLRPGNAVIALRDDDGKILWSWHIWVPADPVVTASYGGIMGGDLMDRNLGALVATKADEAQIDPLSYGLVYQWGRKDPFTAAGTYNGSKPATWAGAPDVVAPSAITLEQSIADPRLLGHIDNGDWLVTSDDAMWSDTEKTVYDPCPPGYRVPAMNPAVPFWNNISSQTGWAINPSYGWLTIGDPAAVFPIAGYRDDYSVGGMAKVGVRTLYWTSNGSGAKATGDDLRSDKGTYKLTTAPKARLGSVRCVAE